MKAGFAQSNFTIFSFWGQNYLISDCREKFLWWFQMDLGKGSSLDLKPSFSCHASSFLKHSVERINFLLDQS